MDPRSNAEKKMVNILKNKINNFLDKEIKSLPIEDVYRNRVDGLKNYYSEHLGKFMRLFLIDRKDIKAVKRYIDDDIIGKDTPNKDKSTLQDLFKNVPQDIKKSNLLNNFLNEVGYMEFFDIVRTAEGIEKFFNTKKQEFINAIKSQYKTETEITANINSFTNDEFYELKKNNVIEEQRNLLIRLNDKYKQKLFDQKFDEIKNYIPFKDDETKVNFFKEGLKKDPKKINELFDSVIRIIRSFQENEEYIKVYIQDEVNKLYKSFEDRENSRLFDQNFNRIKDYISFKDDEAKMNFFKEELKKNQEKLDELIKNIKDYRIEVEKEHDKSDAEYIDDYVKVYAQNEVGKLYKSFEDLNKHIENMFKKEIAPVLSSDENFTDIDGLFTEYIDYINNINENDNIKEIVSKGEKFNLVEDKIDKVEKDLDNSIKRLIKINSDIEFYKDDNSMKKLLEDRSKKASKKQNEFKNSLTKSEEEKKSLKEHVKELIEANEEKINKEITIFKEKFNNLLSKKIDLNNNPNIKEYIDNVLLKGSNLNEIKENFNNFKKYLEDANNSLKVELDSKILGLKDEKFKNFIEGSKEAKSVALDEYKKYLKARPNQEEQPFEFTNLKKEYINFANIFSRHNVIIQTKTGIDFVLDEDILKKYDDLKNYIKIFKNNETVVAEANKLTDHGAENISSELSKEDEKKFRSIYDNKVKVALSRGSTLEEINKKTREEVLKEILGSTEDILKGEVFGSQIDSGDKGTIRGAIENKNFFKRPFDSFRTFKESIEGNLQNVNTEDFMKNFMKNFVESSERKISGKSRIKAFSGREEQRKFSVFFLKSMESTLNAIQNNMDFLDKKDRDFFSGYSLKINETIKKIESKYLNETAKKDFDEKAKIFETEVETKNNIRKIKATIKDKDSGFTNVENDKCIKLSHYDSKKGEVVDLEGEEINKFFEGHQELRERVEGLRQNLNEENIKAFEEEVKKTDLTKMEPCNFAFVYKKDGKQKIHIVNFGGKEDEKAQCSTKLKLVNGREIEVSLNEKNECIFKEGDELVSESTKNILNRVFDVEGVRLEQEKTLQQKLVLDKGKKDKSTQTIQL